MIFLEKFHHKVQLPEVDLCFGWSRVTFFESFDVAGDEVSAPWSPALSCSSQLCCKLRIFRKKMINGALKQTDVKNDIS